MAFNPRAVMERTKSFLAASGRFPGGVTIGEPKSPPGKGMAAAVILGPITITELSLTTASGRIDLIIRLYRDAIDEPLDQTEFIMGQTILELFEDFCGDFDFGDDDVRNLLPLNLSGTPGYQQIGSNTMYRIADITVPLMVNDIASLAK